MPPLWSKTLPIWHWPIGSVKSCFRGRCAAVVWIPEAPASTDWRRSTLRSVCGSIRRHWIRRYNERREESIRWSTAAITKEVIEENGRSYRTAAMRLTYIIDTSFLKSCRVYRTEQAFTVMRQVLSSKGISCPAKGMVFRIEADWVPDVRFNSQSVLCTGISKHLTGNK